MSLLAKVFVVIMTIMIMVDLGVSATLYQHRRDWRNSYAKLRERSKVSTQLAVKEIDSLRAGIKAKDSFISQKQTEVIDLKKELDKQNSAFSETKQLLNKAEDNFQKQMRLTESANQSKVQSETNLEKERTLNHELTQNLDTATRRREIAEGQVARLVQLKTSLEKDIGDLRVNYSDARKSLKEKETLIAMAQEHGVDFVALLSGPPVPAIDARVAAVKNDVQPGLVLLSVGSDDKVEKGFHFSIYRGNEFVGKVVVEKVLASSCGCRVLFTKEGATIQPGDCAATRIQ